MTNSSLDKALDDAISVFVKETSLRFNGIDSDEPATKHDLFELSKQVAYALNDFKEALSKEVK